MKHFLTAEWRNLVMANYKISPDSLAPYLPAKTELDFFKGKCYISLVGFMFCNTQVLGVKIPFHTNFEEVNLRFYVRYHDGAVLKRGTVFIKEIVPRHAISFVANTFYNEHYLTLPMSHLWEDAKDYKQINYEWGAKKSMNFIKVKTLLHPEPLISGSEEEFITEHYWGYTRINDKKTSEYEVEHPKWNIYKVLEYEINCDNESLYGPSLAGFLKMDPVSVFLADGSAISVNQKRII